MGSSLPPGASPTGPFAQLSDNLVYLFILSSDSQNARGEWVLEEKGIRGQVILADTK